MIRYPNQDSITNIDKKILEFWEKYDIPSRSITSRIHNRPFVFYEGPPSANGMPGIHHVVSRTVKDIFCRYKSQKGYYVQRKGGWDTHGLPVELAVEKKLGIKKEDIGKKISIIDYNNYCKETVLQYKKSWDEITTRLGYWLDLHNPYITYDPKYIESLWCIIKQLYTKRLLYKGYTIQPYSPVAGTGISNAELNQPGCYKIVKDISIVAQFKVSNSDDYLLAWTTTPWTLPANSALAVGEHILYTKVKTFNPYTGKPISVILAKDALSRYFQGEESTTDDDFKNYDVKNPKTPWRVIDEFLGSRLLNIKYDQLLPYIQPEGEAFKVISGDFVTATDGTGIVHIAPTFGADDMRVAKKFGIPPILVRSDDGTMVPIVDRHGRFVKEISDFAGLFVKDDYASEADLAHPNYKSVDTLIAIKLKSENKLFALKKYEHSYPHCWRTDKAIIYYPLDSWFIKTTAVKDRLVELNKTINWIPKSIGEGRFGNWLENIVDWNLSRDRFWGTPLPIWRTKDGKEERCIGSVDELKSEVEKAVNHGLMQDTISDDFDPHRPYVDTIILVSSTGTPMYREPDLIDVWFDSGAMPYAQWHYPFENKDEFKKNFPAQFIAEGVDQTRGWFFTLHVLAVMLHDTVAFENVVVNGLVLDKNGIKMSKRLGNTINPFDLIERHGADAVRWYIVNNANIYDNLRFNPEGIDEVIKRFFGTLQNTYKFFSLYANIDSYQGSLDTKLEISQRIDKWIISRLNSLIKDVTSAYDDYNPKEASTLIQDFVVDELSNWYVRLNRGRFWSGENDFTKKSAYDVLFHSLVAIAQLIAPIAPFYAERLYKDLLAKDNSTSVHLTTFPAYDVELIDTNLETKMLLVRSIVSMGHSIRKSRSIRVRQPLSKVFISCANVGMHLDIKAFSQIIQLELNVKDVVFTDNITGMIYKSIKPNFGSTALMAHRSKMKDIVSAIGKLTQDDIKTLESKGNIEVVLSDQEALRLAVTDFLISFVDTPGLSVATDGNVTVAFETTLTDDLVHEGIARDIVNRIQNLRKSNNFDVLDKVEVTIFSQDVVANSAIDNNRRYIACEVQATRLSLLANLPNFEGFDKAEIDSRDIYIKICKSLD